MENAKDQNSMNETKRCTRCNCTKPFSEFIVGENEIRARCRSCCTAQSKKRKRQEINDEIINKENAVDLANVTDYIYNILLEHKNLNEDFESQIKVQLNFNIILDSIYEEVPVNVIEKDKNLYIASLVINAISGGDGYTYVHQSTYESKKQDFVVLTYWCNARSELCRFHKKVDDISKRRKIRTACNLDNNNNTCLISNQITNSEDIIEQNSEDLQNENIVEQNSEDLQNENIVEQNSEDLQNENIVEQKHTRLYQAQCILNESKTFHNHQNESIQNDQSIYKSEIFFETDLNKLIQNDQSICSNCEHDYENDANDQSDQELPQYDKVSQQIFCKYCKQHKKQNVFGSTESINFGHKLSIKEQAFSDQYIDAIKLNTAEETLDNESG
ncbi:22167_t:CDS:2 [Dentiscutata erythropus]|uniref:22167_t:CDS:1 n=1 Tax=Dentiscutata erythropus TaxID=1348616 RepID=A0A9N9NQ72_9GLOM|nr:22167_t:CDS:2 [Dentiscutata erythropus]